MTVLAAREALPDASIEEANARIAAGLYGEALAIIRQALSVRPGDVALLSAQAATLFAWGRFREAREAYEPIITQGVASLQDCLQLGWLQSFVGQVSESEAWMRRAILMEPDSKEARDGLATALLRQGRLDDAMDVCAAGSKRWPSDVRFAFCLGRCQLRRGNPVEAESSFRRVIESEPKQPTAWMNLGRSLRLQERHAEALEAFDQAVCIAAKTGEATDAFVEVAAEYQLMGQNEKAAAVLEGALAQQPTVEGYRAYAELLLALGRFQEGWHHYESRWLLEPLLSTRPGPGVPEWSGQDLSGKTVLLRVEQGFGDVIMTLRYAPSLKALGATVVLGKFSDLAYGFAGVDQVLHEDTAPPHLDYYIPVMSLPRVFGADAGSIPAKVPYVRVDAARAERWRKRLAANARLQVGFAWAGGPSHPWDRYRSMALHHLTSLFDVEGVRFVSLQKDSTENLVPTLPMRLDLVNLGPEFEDLADAAAVIGQLDLVICVDTAVAHLAGALGKPVWVMLARPSDWRWLKDREDSPWYPTMRLFRQRDPGDWPEVVARVKSALQQRVQGDTAAPSADNPVKHAPLLPKSTLARLSPGHKPGFPAVAEARVGIVQYFPDEPIVGDSISWYGEYLQPRLNLLGRLIRPGATLMEVGAGVGVHALHLAGAIAPTGHLFLYEPRPLMQRVLRQNLAANRVGNVTLMKGTPGATSERIDRNRETIDELHLEQLQLLKIDEDAPALDVLAGAGDTLWRLRPMLCVASRNAVALSELATVARDYGYRCLAMETPLFNPGNFNRREDDIFAGKKATALLAIPEEIEMDFPLEGCAEL